MKIQIPDKVKHKVSKKKWESRESQWSFQRFEFPAFFDTIAKNRKSAGNSNNRTPHSEYHHLCFNNAVKT